LYVVEQKALDEMEMGRGGGKWYAFIDPFFQVSSEEGL
jgi:hypothetical protein